MAYLENGVLRSRPRYFFSQRLYRWSLVAQHPTLMTWREFISLLLFLYAAFQAYFTLAKLYILLWGLDVDQICGHDAVAMRCLQRYTTLAVWEMLRWLGKIVTWLPIAIVIIFVGEEVISRKKHHAS